MRVQLSDGTFSEAIGVPVLGATMTSTGMDVTLDASGADLTALAQNGEKAKDERRARDAIAAPQEADDARGGKLSAGALAGIGVGAVVVAALLAAAVVAAVQARRRTSVTPRGSGEGGSGGGSGQSMFAGMRRVLAPQQREGGAAPGRRTREDGVAVDTGAQDDADVDGSDDEQVRCNDAVMRNDLVAGVGHVQRSAWTCLPTVCRRLAHDVAP